MAETGADHMLYNGFDNENILHIAMEQSAIDANCQADDFF